MSVLFNLLETDSGARRGELTTSRSVVPTPAFMPVATQGTVKTLTPEEVGGLGFGMLLANTYHLYLRPGIPLIERAGGLHRFMAWEGAVLTDSGGYQVFSLAALRRVNDEGVVFRSHIDGSEHLITPELAVEYQESLGSDIAMVLDECSAPDVGREKTAAAVARTGLWAERCLEAHKRRGQALFAIVQGGVFPDLRRRSAEHLASLDFPGYAVGGLSLGEPKTVTGEMVAAAVECLPGNKPRYLMGVGSPEDIVAGVSLGIDLFDSALPTRVARNGALFTGRGRVDISNAAYRQMEGPFDAGCGCYACRTFSAAYLHHLFRTRELLFHRLATLHNLAFIARLMEDIRSAVRDGTFASFRSEFLGKYRPTDETVRLEQKRRQRKPSRHSDLPLSF